MLVHQRRGILDVSGSPVDSSYRQSIPSQQVSELFPEASGPPDCVLPNGQSCSESLAETLAVSSWPCGQAVGFPEICSRRGGASVQVSLRPEPCCSSQERGRALPVDARDGLCASSPGNGPRVAHRSDQQAQAVFGRTAAGSQLHLFPGQTLASGRRRPQGLRAGHTWTHT